MVVDGGLEPGITHPFRTENNGSKRLSVVVVIGRIIIILYFRREGTKYILSIVKREKIGIKCITP